jgi:hypothetical protein
MCALKTNHIVGNFYVINPLFRVGVSDSIVQFHNYLVHFGMCPNIYRGPTTLVKFLNFDNVAQLQRFDGTFSASLSCQKKYFLRQSL